MHSVDPEKVIYIVGTADTKGEELQYVKRLINETGVWSKLVDVGTRHPKIPVDVAAGTVAEYHSKGSAAPLGTEDRGEAVSAMTEAFVQYITSCSDVGGVIGVGGGGGTAIITAGMRELRIGLPKLMVSTLASGDVGAFVGASDITMMYSVTDIAGLNRISRTVLRNAANAIVSMARNAQEERDGKLAIGLTMFGVTTPSVSQAIEHLRADYDCLVFHATGSGGRAMEKLVDSRLISGVIDVTTTEIADLLVGGVMRASEDRLGAIARTKAPYVGSVGATDIVNFWTLDTIPPQCRNRNLYRHNPQVMLMRTTPRECIEIGTWIADRLNRCTGPVRFLLPEKGVSALDAPGQPFYDPDADDALFSAIERTLHQTSSRRLIRLPLHINDPAFSSALVDAFRSIVSSN